ncbi:MAG: response regulator [Proteobacteria bacterium]|nr:response regulator [Pseudomonadota bacterium]
MITPLAKMARQGLAVPRHVGLQFVTVFLGVATLLIGGVAAAVLGPVFGAIALSGVVGLVVSHLLARRELIRPSAGALMLALLAMPCMGAVIFGSFWVLPLAAVPAYPAVASIACCPRGGYAMGAVTALLLAVYAVIYPDPMVLSGVEVPVLAGVTTALCWTAVMTVAPAHALLTRESIDQTAKALGNIPDFTVIVDPATEEVVWANVAAHQELGHDELVGMKRDVFARWDIREPDALRRAIAEGVLLGTHTRADGSEYRAQVHISELMVGARRLHVACARDISDIEQSMMQSERRLVAAQLSTGLVHDFNNLLSVIHYAGLELSGLVPESGRDAVTDLQAASDRSRELVGAMLDLSRSKLRTSQLTPLTARLRRTVGLVARVLPQDVTLELEIESDQPVAVDLVELDQVVVNLVVNARDALLLGGKIRLELEQVTSGLALRVIDNGTGMDAETLKRAKEPFFSTKTAVGGTGLGLSTVNALVQRWNGRLAIESTLDRGTTVTVFIPTQGAVVAPVILLVDDEPLIRRAYRRMLQREGLVALEAGSAAEALEILGSGERIDLMISDWVMPGEDGGWLGREAAKLYPGLPIVFVSGASQRGQPANMLRKPISGDELLARVLSELGQSSPAAALSSVS